jgi:myo-inositol-1(or 4)-monophosphatase
LAKELEVAIAATEAAGEVLRSGFSQEQQIEYKGEVDLVTEADERAEQTIKEVLQDAFPDYEILTEESGRLGGGGSEEARWIVDPLDGTTNYTHALPFFATSIALERNGEVVLGVVHDPMAEEMYTAERGQGATLNGQSIKVTDTAELIRALLATSFSHAEEEDMSVGLDLFGRLTNLTRGVRQLGSGALDLCYVAAGRLDGCFERGLSAWDVAAGMLIVEEAGGKISDYQGGEFDLEGTEMVASNGSLHPALVSVTSGGRG